MFNKSVNKVILVGNLGKDPEMRYMPNGGAVANLTIATTKNWKDKQTNERKEKTEWHRLVVFNRLGEMCGEYLKKGVKIYIEGELVTRKWKDQQQQDRYTTEIVVNEIQLLSSQNNQAHEQYQAYQQNQSLARQAPARQAPVRQQAPAHQPQNAPQQQAPEPQQAPVPYYEPPMDFDDSIPF